MRCFGVLNFYCSIIPQITSHLSVVPRRGIQWREPIGDLERDKSNLDISYVSLTYFLTCSHFLSYFASPPPPPGARRHLPTNTGSVDRDTAVAVPRGASQHISVGGLVELLQWRKLELRAHNILGSLSGGLSRGLHCI